MGRQARSIHRDFYSYLVATRITLKVKPRASGCETFSEPKDPFPAGSPALARPGGAVVPSPLLQDRAPARKSWRSWPRPSGLPRPAWASWTRPSSHRVYLSISANSSSTSRSVRAFLSGSPLGVHPRPVSLAPVSRSRHLTPGRSIARGATAPKRWIRSSVGRQALLDLGHDAVHVEGPKFRVGLTLHIMAQDAKRPASLHEAKVPGNLGRDSKRPARTVDRRVGVLAGGGRGFPLSFSKTAEAGTAITSPIKREVIA